MTAPIGGQQIFGQASAFSGPGGELGKEEFLELLVAQLSNQDPLNPLQGNEMAVQLAQFSQVEQLIAINDQLSGQAFDSAALGFGLDTSIGASLIGKQVLAAGNLVGVAEGGAASVTFDVGAGGGDATVVLFDEFGTEVGTYELGRVGPGRQTLQWDADGVPEGVYGYDVSVRLGDVDVGVETYTGGVVRGVHFENGRVVLQAGGVNIPLEQLAEIVAVE